MLDTVRWVHHALYVTTTALTVAAVLEGRRRPAARLLAPALVPLALIPYLGRHGRRHVVVAASAAPWYASALLTLALGRG